MPTYTVPQKTKDLIQEFVKANLEFRAEASEHDGGYKNAHKNGKRPSLEEWRVNIRKELSNEEKKLAKGILKELEKHTDDAGKKGSITIPVKGKVTMISIKDQPELNKALEGYLSENIDALTLEITFIRKQRALKTRLRNPDPLSDNEAEALLTLKDEISEMRRKRGYPEDIIEYNSLIMESDILSSKKDRLDADTQRIEKIRQRLPKLKEDMDKLYKPSSKPQNNKKDNNPYPDPDTVSMLDTNPNVETPSAMEAKFAQILQNSDHIGPVQNFKDSLPLAKKKPNTRNFASPA